MKNEYEIRGDVAVIIVNSKKLGVKEALIDSEDLPLVSNISGSWTLNGYDKPYVVGRMGTVVGKRISESLHRYILGNVPRGLVVDHINRNPLDNRKTNLRIVTYEENARNSDYYDKHFRITQKA